MYPYEQEPLKKQGYDASDEPKLYHVVNEFSGLALTASLNLSLGNFPKASKRIPKTPRESMVCKWLAVLHMLAVATVCADEQGRLCKWVNCVAMVCSAHTWLGLQGGCCLRTQPNATLECNTRTTHVRTLALQALQS